MISGPKHVAPQQAKKVELWWYNDPTRLWAPQRAILRYDGKPAPFPVVLQPSLVGIRGVGQRIAEIWREST